MRETEKLLRTVENNIAIVGLRSDGILHLCYKRDLELDKSAIDELLKMVVEFTYPNKYPFLIELDDYISFQEEGRKYMAEIDAIIPSIKTALVLDSIGYKMIVNHFINHNKPEKEYSVFKDFETAVKWLKS